MCIEALKKQANAQGSDYCLNQKNYTSDDTFSGILYPEIKHFLLEKKPNFEKKGWKVEQF